MAMLDTTEVAEMYEEFADDYDETVLKEYGYTAHSVIPTFLIDKLNTVHKGHKVLDLGCGTGLSSLEFFAHNARVTGEDFRAALAIVLPPVVTVAAIGLPVATGAVAIVGAAAVGAAAVGAAAVGAAALIGAGAALVGGAAAVKYATFSVMGMDLSPAMLDKASQLPYYQLLRGNVEDPLPFKEGYFSAVVMIGVMEFITDVNVVLTRIHRTLPSGGWLGISVPKKLDDVQEWELSIRTYELSDMETELVRAGFEVVATKELLGYRLDDIDVNYNLYFCRALKPSSTELLPALSFGECNEKASKGIDGIILTGVALTGAALTSLGFAALRLVGGTLKLASAGC
jgi:predicted TPR repeat methyltransferase